MLAVEGWQLTDRQVCAGVAGGAPSAWDTTGLSCTVCGGDGGGRGALQPAAPPAASRTHSSGVRLAPRGPLCLLDILRGALASPPPPPSGSQCQMPLNPMLLSRTWAPQLSLPWIDFCRPGGRAGPPWLPPQLADRRACWSPRRATPFHMCWRSSRSRKHLCARVCPAPVSVPRRPRGDIQQLAADSP